MGDHSWRGVELLAAPLGTLFEGGASEAPLGYWDDEPEMREESGGNRSRSPDG